MPTWIYLFTYKITLFSKVRVRIFNLAVHRLHNPLATYVNKSVSKITSFANVEILKLMFIGCIDKLNKMLIQWIKLIPRYSIIQIVNLCSVFPYCNLFIFLTLIMKFAQNVSCSSGAQPQNLLKKSSQLKQSPENINENIKFSQTKMNKVNIFQIIKIEALLLKKWLQQTSRFCAKSLPFRFPPFTVVLGTWWFTLIKISQEAILLSTLLT